MMMPLEIPRLQRRSCANPPLGTLPSPNYETVSGPHGTGKEYNNLARRVLGRLPGGNARGSIDVPDRRAEAAARRSADESRQPLQEVSHSRVLRSRRSAAEQLCVVPNANRGIPKVPNIPEKFVIYDEDTENIAPAQRLRY
ncbi:hypothetical protein NM208_g16019 [Fusarium decemcellulare]|uniref:Uncharacterized protein n=1 Tax=Fusarium decemcellulare TaxID=57161 RepID=A0ACC1RCW2_9HYPO|nr:hypothetical protein NM208_g16019 [Fusarium decemcellulare]